MKCQADDDVFPRGWDFRVPATDDDGSCLHRQRQHEQHFLLSHGQQIMGDEYDDWGNPKRPRREMPREKGLLGALKFYGNRAFRQYRTLLSAALFLVCLLYYFLGTTGEPAPKPIDWSRYAYVQ